MPLSRDRRRPGSEEPAESHVTQRELDSELRGINFKLKVVGAIAAINLPLNFAALASKGAVPAAFAFVHQLFS